ncbi:HpcH/HpaI aldolase family protein [Bradyrhizobium manausense]|uniref:HpcH/HpaI aldolase/citrate lyase domain-containing protein n=1 Tax=Bradyrhizobium manausense TaxID=989370 RepID=A0A0R3E8A7_9BRAD|nr:aldolase/citrate lyase family protein [Bradyrhizobium manausense]KRQ15794.1 hypothetical protein AOQ71_07880 [Bradyrhizobium manausense]
MTIDYKRPAFGSFIVEHASVSTVRIAASADADFLIFDGEHGCMESASLRNAIAMCNALSIDAVVRVPAVDSELLSQGLDAGARGILIPNVQSAEEAQLAVARAKFPPAGKRGAAFGSAQDGYAGGNVASKIVEANARTLILCMIESPLGMAQANRIASIEGVDGLWFGYIDFSIAASVPGQLEHELVTAARKQIAAACRDHSKRACVMVTSAAELSRYAEDGFDVIAYGSDAFVMKQGFSTGIELCRRQFGNLQ